MKNRLLEVREKREGIILADILSQITLGFCDYLHKKPTKHVKMMICRKIFDDLTSWKNSFSRKPLLLKGARQIGKSWTMEHFGSENFEFTAKFDFDENPELCQVFERTKDVERLLKELALYVDVPLEAGRTLLIFDEIQACEAALNSLKYFCENAPAYHVMAAGSLLGVAVRQKKMQVPVGKVTIQEMFPVTFSEFLRTSDERLWRYIEFLEGVEHLPEIVLNKLCLEYRRYLVCGGMPEAVMALLENRGMSQVDKVLQDILDMYELDFVKYAEPTMIPRIHALWNSLPSQLAKENRKFLYRVVKEGARAREYEEALLWLEEAGMIQRCFNASKPGMPLSAYRDVSAFKVYACDCGLLRRLAKLPAEIVLDGNANYTEFRGALAENAILQSLRHQCDEIPYYWSSNSTAEVDFLLQLSTEIVPVEVKAENRISGKSLSVYTKKFLPQKRIRYSMNNLQENDGLLSCPCPLADWTKELLQKMHS